MNPADMDQVLRGLVELLPTQILELELSDPVPCELAPELDTKTVDDLLQEAEHQGLLTGTRQLGDGSICWWHKLELTWRGLERLGECPHPGSELLEGPWQEGYWAKMAEPLLREMNEDPPEHGFFFAPAGGASDDEWRRYQCVRRLISVGLLRGRDGGPGQGISELAVTEHGHHALAEGPSDPLDRARNELQRGAKADAMTAAVEEVLRERLIALALQHGIPTVKPNGRPADLAAINDQLSALPKDVRAEIAFYLKLRNETNHGRGAAISATRIRRAIDGIRELRDTGTI